MAIVGGNLEKKEIGLPIDISGTHSNTVIDATTGQLRLVKTDVDGAGVSIFAEEGTWTSDVINLGDNFQDFEKVFTTHTHNDSSSLAFSTRVSDKGIDWSDWKPTAMDGTIQSDTKQYIQLRIDLYAGFVSDVFLIAKSDFEDNRFVEEVEATKGSYVVPILTSNTSSPLGFAFSETEYNATYPTWKAFDGINNAGYITQNNVISGFSGFYFNEKINVTKYRMKSSSTSGYLIAMPKNWVVEASVDTTDGTNGKWVEIDKRVSQTWSAINTDIEYEFENSVKFNAYRVRWTENNGHISYSGVGQLNFYEPSTTALKLKRDYEFNMSVDKTWADTGHLLRKKITHSEWLKIDKLSVL